MLPCRLYQTGNYNYHLTKLNHEVFYFWIDGLRVTITKEIWKISLSLFLLRLWKTFIKTECKRTQASIALLCALLNWLISQIRRYKGFNHYNHVVLYWAQIFLLGMSCLSDWQDDVLTDKQTSCHGCCKAKTWGFIRFWTGEQLGLTSRQRIVKALAALGESGGWHSIGQILEMSFPAFWRYWQCLSTTKIMNCKLVLIW